MRVEYFGSYALERWKCPRMSKNLPATDWAIRVDVVRRVRSPKSLASHEPAKKHWGIKGRLRMRRFSR